MLEKRIDQETARALVDAGYMPVAEYVAKFAPSKVRHIQMDGPPPPQALRNSEAC